MEGLRLLLNHPAVALRDCGDCAKWLYDEQTGKRKARPHGSENWLPRPATVPTPCHACPKKSPAEAKRLELSLRNHQALAYYYQVRVTGGNVAMDEVTARNCGLIDGLVRHHETKVAMQEAVLPLMTMGGGGMGGGIPMTGGKKRGGR